MGQRNAAWMFVATSTSLGPACAVIQGSNEREKSDVTIRDLVLGAGLAASTKEVEPFGGSRS